jgi:hypothetical protein
MTRTHSREPFRDDYSPGKGRCKKINSPVGSHISYFFLITVTKIPDKNNFMAEMIYFGS